MSSPRLSATTSALQRWPWWLLQPRVTPTGGGLDRPAFCCGIPGALMLIYSPPNWFGEPLSGLRADWSGGILDIAIEPESSYHAYYLNPRTGHEVRSYVAQRGQRVELGAVLPREDGFWTPPRKPTMEDWVLVLEDREALAKLTEEPSTQDLRSDPST